MRNTLFLLLLSLAICTSAALAQDGAATSKPAAAAPTTAPARRQAAANAAKPTPTPEATPAPKKRGFLSRVFGGKERATPAPDMPVATPIPASTPRPKRRKPTPAPAATESTPAESSGDGNQEASMPPAPKVEEQPAPRTSAKTGKKSAPVSDQTPPAAQTKEEKAVEAAIASGDPDALEKAKYDLARAKALEDERIRELRVKADSATTDEEARRGYRTYNKALFQKMRSLDSSISDRVNRMETAVLKQLGEQVD